MLSAYAEDIWEKKHRNLLPMPVSPVKKNQLFDPSSLRLHARANHLPNRKTSAEHGIVGNGWYDQTLNEHHF